MSVFRFCSTMWSPPHPRVVFALCLVVAALSFTGCPEAETTTVDPGFTPLYEEDNQLPESLKNTVWKSEYDTDEYPDRYTFTADTLKYGSYEGTVKFIGYFTDAKDSGVIIYEYLADKKQTYFDYDADYKVTGGPYDPPGNFHATYFSDLTSTTVKLGGAYNEKEPHGCETKTLGRALVKFASIDAMQKYAGKRGAYTK